MPSLVIQHQNNAIAVEFQLIDVGMLIESMSHPYLTHLAGSIFPDRELLLRTIDNLMKNQGVMDTIDLIQISPDAIQKWHEVCQRKHKTLKKLRIPKEAIGDEMAQPLKDGRLRIFCRIQGTSDVELILEAYEWRWIEGMMAH